jgi:hypothetical protein
MNYERNTKALVEVLEENVPPTIVVTTKTGEAIDLPKTIYSLNNNTENTLDRIDFFIKQLPQHLHQRGKDFCYLFYSLFPEDAEILAGDIFKSINKHPTYQFSAFFTLFEQFLIDSATFGFQNVYLGFSAGARQRIQAANGQDIFDIRNMLAQRVYLADLISQTLPQRKQKLLKTAQNQRQLTATKISIGKKLVRKRKNVRSLPAIFGSMAEIYEGKILDANAPLILYPDTRYTDTFRYDRFDRDGIFLPEGDRIDALLTLGKLCNRKEHTDRLQTFATVGAMTEAQFVVLFPDLRSEKKVSPAEKQLVEKIFSVPYNEAKELVLATLNQKQPTP